MENEMTCKDLFLAFCEKAGIEVNPTDNEITLYDGARWADFLFKENGDFIEYDIR